MKMKTATLRTKKGIIEVELKTEGDKISHLKITGDFFVYPEEALETIEQGLQNIKIDKMELKKRITEIYEQQKISTPGITIDDWVTVILNTNNL